MSYFNDDFEGYTLGASIPAFPGSLGPWANLIGGGGGGFINVDPVGVYPRASPIPSLPTSTKAMVIGSAGASCSPVFNGLLTFSVLIGNSGSVGRTKLCSIINTFYPTPSTPPLYDGPYTAELLHVFIDQDMTLSLATNLGYLLDPILNIPANSGYAAGSVFGNSFSLKVATWYMIQLSFGFSTFGMSTVIFASGGLSVDGLGILAGKSLATGYTTNNPYFDPTGVHIVPPVGLCNGFIFNGAGGYAGGFGGLVDNVTLDVQGSGWPFPATKPGPESRINHLIVEYATPNFSPTSSGRVSQLVVEVAGIPTKSPDGEFLSANVRDSQLVIEVMGKGGITNPSGWLVKES